MVPLDTIGSPVVSCVCCGDGVQEGGVWEEGDFDAVGVEGFGGWVGDGE